jgi:hypothetical protein
MSRRERDKELDEKSLAWKYRQDMIRRQKKLLELSQTTRDDDPFSMQIAKLDNEEKSG